MCFPPAATNSAMRSSLASLVAWSIMNLLSTGSLGVTPTSCMSRGYEVDEVADEGGLGHGAERIDEDARDQQGQQEDDLVRRIYEERSEDVALEAVDEVGQVVEEEVGDEGVEERDRQHGGELVDAVDE